MVVRNPLAKMSTIAFDGTQFKTSGPFNVPAAGYNRTILFEYDGVDMVERWRGMADVPN